MFPSCHLPTVRHLSVPQIFSWTCKLDPNGRGLLNSLGVLGSASLVSVRRLHSWGYSLDGDNVSYVPAELKESANVRVYRAGRMVETVLDSSELPCLVQALERSGNATESRIEASPVMQDSQGSRRVVSHDARLTEYVCSQSNFYELAAALSANTWHEASRIKGLESFRGHLIYRLNQTFVAGREVYNSCQQWVALSD